MELEVAELALDDEDSCLSLGVLEHDVGERLDVEPGGDLDHAGGHPRARQAPADPGAEVAHGLRLQLVDEDRWNAVRPWLSPHDLAQLLEDELAQLGPRQACSDPAAGGARATVSGRRPGGAPGTPSTARSPSKSPNACAGSEA